MSGFTGHEVATTVADGRVVYHQTAVFEKTEDGFRLDTGGWSTATTKRRMNQSFEAFGINAVVYQEDWEWFVVVDGDWDNPQPYTGTVFVWPKEDTP